MIYPVFSTPLKESAGHYNLPQQIEDEFLRSSLNNSKDNIYPLVPKACGEHCHATYVVGQIHIEHVIAVNRFLTQAYFYPLVLYYSEGRLALQVSPT